MIRAAAVLAALVVLCAATTASAEVVRFAMVIGANRGLAGEESLRYAVDDATKVARVLGELGGVPAEQMTVLVDRDAESVRRALIVLNERIRARRTAGAEIVLYVYYSGHADAHALHLGGTTLELAELEGLVRGSAADLRLLVLDACRSGALTRVKGGRPAPPVSIALDDRLRGEGLAILSSSSGSEDAQESDDLRGSFFTHYLVSALLGAGDDDGDGQVTLREAYRSAYDRTLLASSRTLAGQQHPSFRFELRGRGDVVLTRLRDVSGRASVTFPPNIGFVVSRGADGAVVAEVGVRDRARRLSLPPGRYHVVGRAADALHEGELDLGAGEARTVATSALRRTEYARLVRKGGTALTRVSGPSVGMSIRSAIHDGASPCVGAVVGWPVELAALTLAPRVTACRGSFDNDHLSATTDALDVELRASRAWDLPAVSLDLGLAAGAGLLRESFTTRGEAPANLSAAAHVDVTAGTLVDLPRGTYLGLDVAGQSWFFPAAGDDGGTETTVRFAVRATLSLGVRL